MLDKRLENGDNPGWKYYKNFTMSFSTLMKFFLCPYEDVNLLTAEDVCQQKNQKYKTSVDKMDNSPWKNTDAPLESEPSFARSPVR